MAVFSAPDITYKVNAAEGTITWKLGTVVGRGWDRAYLFANDQIVQKFGPTLESFATVQQLTDGIATDSWPQGQAIEFFWRIVNSDDPSNDRIDLPRFSLTVVDHGERPYNLEVRQLDPNYWGPGYDGDTSTNVLAFAYDGTQTQFMVRYRTSDEPDFDASRQFSASQNPYYAFSQWQPSTTYYWQIATWVYDFDNQMDIFGPWSDEVGTFTTGPGRPVPGPVQGISDTDRVPEFGDNYTETGFFYSPSYSHMITADPTERAVTYWLFIRRADTKQIVVSSGTQYFPNDTGKVYLYGYDLIAATDYEFQVYSYNESGDGPYSDWMPFRTADEPAGVPTLLLPNGWQYSAYGSYAAVFSIGTQMRNVDGWRVYWRLLRDGETVNQLPALKGNWYAEDAGQPTEDYTTWNVAEQQTTSRNVVGNLLTPLPEKASFYYVMVPYNASGEAVSHRPYLLYAQSYSGTNDPSNIGLGTLPVISGAAVPDKDIKIDRVQGNKQSFLTRTLTNFTTGDTVTLPSSNPFPYTWSDLEYGTEYTFGTSYADPYGFGHDDSQQIMVRTLDDPTQFRATADAIVHGATISVANPPDQNATYSLWQRATPENTLIAEGLTLDKFPYTVNDLSPKTELTFYVASDDETYTSSDAKVTPAPYAPSGVLLQLKPRDKAVEYIITYAGEPTEFELYRLTRTDQATEDGELVASEERGVVDVPNSVQLFFRAVAKNVTGSDESPTIETVARPIGETGDPGYVVPGSLGGTGIPVDPTAFGPKVPGSLSETLLWVNGTLVNTLITNVESLAGRLSTPARRGENVSLPTRTGSLRTRKYFDSKDIPLQMWIRGNNQTEWFENYDRLMILFLSSDDITLTFQRPDGSKRTITGEVTQALEPTISGNFVSGNPSASLGIIVTAVEPFWTEVYGTSILDRRRVTLYNRRTPDGLTLLKDQNGWVDLTAFANSTAPIEDLGLVFGANTKLTNPRLVVENSDVSLTYRGTLQAGERISFGCGQWTLDYLPADFLPSRIEHRGTPRWFVLPPRKRIRFLVDQNPDDKQFGDATLEMYGLNKFLTA